MEPAVSEIFTQDAVLDGIQIVFLTLYVDELDVPTLSSKNQKPCLCDGILFCKLVK